MLTKPFKTSFQISLLTLFFTFLWGENYSQTQPCTLSCTDIVRSADPGKCGANVTYSVTSGDCGTVTTSHPSGSFFPVGTTTVNVSTSSGQRCSFTVRVNDAERPVIESVTATPKVLWSPNHKMVPVTVNIKSRDNCGIAECKIIGVSSNEPTNGLGDGDTAPDWQIIDKTRVNLRAERSGTGNGRVYTITVQCTDIYQNSSTSTVLVTVPHDQSPKTTENTDKNKDKTNKADDKKVKKDDDKKVKKDDDKKVKKVKQKK